MAPDMAIVGEVCDREARVLLSLSSGADVFTTISCRFGPPVLPGSEIVAVGPPDGAELERLPTGRMQW